MVGYQRFSLKVFLVIRDLSPGGTQRQVILLANALSRSGQRVGILTFYDTLDGYSSHLDANVVCHSLHKAGRWDLLGFAIRFARVLRQSRPDVLYSFLDGANLFSALMSMIVKGCHHRLVWGIRSSFMDWSAYDWTWKLLNRLLFCLARSPDLVVFNSIRGQHYYAEKGFRPRQQIVIANGVDTQRFYPDAQVRSQMRTELAVDSDNVLIGTVGRIDPIKDLQTFIAVASRLIDLDPRYRFVIVGSGPSADERALQQAIEQNKMTQSVVRVKQSARVHDYYNAMDIFVSCSRGEGFPNTVGEAMACGVPCIVTDVGDCRLLVGDTGVVVDIGDTTAIVAGVRKLESQISLGSVTQQSITKRVQVEFSVERLCSRSVTAFQALMPIE